MVGSASHVKAPVPRLRTFWGRYVAANGYSRWAKESSKLLDAYGWILIRIDNVVERLMYLNGAYSHLGSDEDFPPETC